MSTVNISDNPFILSNRVFLVILVLPHEYRCCCEMFGRVLLVAYYPQYLRRRVLKEMRTSRTARVLNWLRSMYQLLSLVD